MQCAATIEKHFLNKTTLKTCVLPIPAFGNTELQIVLVLGFTGVGDCGLNLCRTLFTADVLC